MFVGLVWLTSNHIFGSGNFWDKSPTWFLKILKVSRFAWTILKFFKNLPGQFISNRPPKHVINSTVYNIISFTTSLTVRRTSCAWMLHFNAIFIDKVFAKQESFFLIILAGMRCLWDVSNRSPLREKSQIPLKNISKRCRFCDVFKTSQIHLKKDVFFVTSLRLLKYISKKTSQIHLKKYVFQVTSLRRQTYLKKRCLFSDVKNISWKYLWLFQNITQKWFRADKIYVWALKTLKKMKRRFLGAMHSH